ncbi:ribosome-inactivating family protein [Streptomyces sp. NPDC047081]|uniref:ribosome-inactivating family protein n=1 Tax=Streptomyces sp. NPDC047081 TaxID=3154706 RepID=UPI003404AE11
MRVLSRRLLLTAAVPTLVAGAVLVSGVAPAHTAGPSAAAVHLGGHDIELSASSSYPQIHWDVDGGGSSYKSMLQNLAALQLSYTHGRKINVPVGSSSRTVIVTDNTAVNSFADIVATSGGQTVHLLVRLSDLYVTGWYYESNGEHYWPLASQNAPRRTDADIHVNWEGAENYNRLATLGNIALADVQIGHHGLYQAIHDLRNPEGAGTQAVARALLRMIFAVSEGSRFNWISGGVYNALNNGQDFRMTQTGVELVRNWAGISHVLVDHVAHGNASTSSVSTQSFGHISTAAAAAKLLLTALNDGQDPNPRDEL